LSFLIRLVAPYRDLQAFVGFLKVIDVQGHQLTAPEGSAESEQQLRPVTPLRPSGMTPASEGHAMWFRSLSIVPARLLRGTENGARAAWSATALDLASVDMARADSAKLAVGRLRVIRWLFMTAGAIGSHLWPP
jgi:hypothetical protein